MRRLLPLVLIPLLAACGGPDKGAASKAPVPKATPKPWRVSNYDPDAEAPALLWNGLVGVRIGPSGAGIDREGASLSVFQIDEYQPAGEEKIVVLSNPLGVVWDFDGRSSAKGPYQNYSQDLNFTTGELRTTYSIELPNNKAYVKCSTFIHPSERQIVQRWLVTTDRETPVRLITFASAPGSSRQSPSGHEYEHVYRLGESGTQARVRQVLRTRNEGQWTPQSGGFVWSGTARSYAGFTLDRTISFGPGGNLAALRKAMGRDNDLPPGWDVPPPALTYADVRNANSDVWKKRWETDIEIEGPVEDQQAIRSFLFYLRSATSANSDMSISPFALSNQLYNGHVFWDADIWVFPALALIDPAAAKEIADYRLARVGAAKSHYMDSMWGNRPLGGLVLRYRYPWESSVSGRETAPSSHRNEIHISGSVAWMLSNAAALGLTDGDRAQSVVHGVGNFFLDWAGGRKSLPLPGSDLELKEVMSPDENHIGNNDLYTNLLAQWCVNGGEWEGKYRFKLPRDETSFLTYDDDALRSYKQAAAVLAIYPLQYPEAEKQAKVMMERFAGKVTPNGPAMSDSLHALIWARLQENDKAYDTWRKSWQEFTNHPLLLFSEKRRKELTYFTTGAGGCLQTVIYGFLGFRLDNEKEPGAVWSKQLPRGRWLSIKPNLPKAWKSVKFKNFRVLGRTYTLTVTHQGAHVTEGDK